MLSQHIPGEETGKRSKKMRESNLTHSTVLEDSSLKVSTRNEKTRKWGLFVTGVVGGTLMTLYAIATPFVAPAFRKICLPYVPATNEQIRNVLKMLQLRSGHLVDIGSGDGRIVIAAAKKGFQAEGYELNPWLVWYSRYRAWREGVNHNAKFHRLDMWKFPSLPQEWQTVASHFAIRWDFLNCGGSIDGKHVHIVPPPHSGRTIITTRGFTVLC
ncbi:ATP synthase subunit C lysine N-methyltransferase isoform X4 [Lithobates pipiens]